MTLRTGRVRPPSPLPSLQGSLGAVLPPGSPWAVCWQELEAIKLKLWAMEQAQRPKPPGEQGPEGEEEDATALLAGQLLSPETGRNQRARPNPSLGRGPQVLGREGKWG